MKTLMPKRRAVVRASLLLFAATLALAPLACKRSTQVKIKETEEEPARLASIVHTSDPKTAGQLASGFYDVENNSWRWTQRRFIVVLRPPATANQKGAVLNFKFAIPDVVLAKLKDVTLSATVNGSAVAPETYKTAGEFTYSRDIPTNLLTGESVRVEFTLDKAIAPSEADLRELGLVAHSVGLELK